MENFDILKYSLYFEEPDNIASPSAWIEHIPFSFFLIEILKPSIFVELGTHTGTSFNAMCQAVKTLNIKTKCYAVDKWEGDFHAGFYSDNVYLTLSQYQDENYKAFAELMKMSFDEASETFSDGSIDLLHIDGLHTYEAVKHDFETWLPKLSDKGVVIFHDTVERRDDFGVWKLWEEICSRYPSYTFNYGYGLGILAVGNSVSEDFISFLKSANEKIFFQNLFGRLGNNVLCKDELKIVKNELNQLKKHLNQLETYLSNLEFYVNQLETDITNKNVELQQKQNELLQVQNNLSQVQYILNQKNDELNNILKSRTWRWSNKIASLIKFIVPKSSFWSK